MNARPIHGFILRHLASVDKPGDNLLAHLEATGRHFGMKVEESLIER